MRVDYPTGVELMTDLSAAAWIEEALADWPDPFIYPVGCAIPEGFASYTRIFHPIRRHEDGREVPQRWADFAAERGKVAHVGMQFESLIGTIDWQREPWDSMAPEWGGLPEEECRRLSEILRPFTEVPDTCWYCLWDGYGIRHWVDDQVWTRLPTLGDRRAGLSPASAAREAEREERLARVPRVRTLWGGVAPERFPGREYLLFEGPLEAVMGFRFGPRSFQSPNLWWPADLSWCVATEVDGFTSFVGGTEPAIDALVQATGIEALRIDPAQRFDIGSDSLNGLPPDFPPA